MKLIVSIGLFSSYLSGQSSHGKRPRRRQCALSMAQQTRVEMIDLRHPLAVLASRMPQKWGEFVARVTKLVNRSSNSLTLA